MVNEIMTYLDENGLDSDVFFTNGDGPISPIMREDWIADHKLAVEHPDITYDNDTGFYNFTFRVPDSLARNYVENKKQARATYDKYEQVNIQFMNSGVYLTGSVQTPGTAVLLSKMVEGSNPLIQS